MALIGKVKKRGKWGSKMGFILAASGSAVGLGNIWRFPYTAGENGGAVFVMIYLAAILFVGLPVLVAEISMGRFSGQNPVGAFKAIKENSQWKLVGYLGVFTGVMILSYYSVIAGWTIGYFYKSVTGKFSQLSSTNAGEIFSSFTADAPLQIGLLALFLLLTVYIVSRGISGGIEKFAKIFMPLLFLILLLLLIRSLTLEGASKGLEFYLQPDFSKMNFKVVYYALGQAFFSLSLGMGTMVTYGSYLGKKENLPSAAGWVAFFDTLIAIMAGFIIFPAIFSQGMNPAGGPGLVFNILPVIFAKMPGGVVFGPLFFALLCIAALTSTISLLEVPVSYLIDEKQKKRKKSAYILGAITFVFAIPSALSAGGVKFFSKLPIINMDFLSFWDLVWGNLSLSVGALFMAVFVAYVWKTSNALKELKQGAEGFKLSKLWIFCLKFLAPVFIFIILIGIILFEVLGF